MFGRFVALIFRLTDWILLLLMSAMCVVMLTQVFSRYLFNNPLTWPEELSRYLFVWIVFLGAAIAFRHKAHLGMDFLTARLPERLRRGAEKIVEIIILVFLVLIMYIAPAVLSVTRLQTTPVLNIPMSYIYLSFVVASGLMSIEIVDRWLFSYQRWAGKCDEPEPGEPAPAKK
jgi:TRAP-type C4-dicarboxylate transport system permease small subunit